MAARPAPKPAHPRIQDLVTGFGSMKRWRILMELGKGEPLPAREISRRVRISPNGASKILSELHKAGILDRGYGNLYRIPARFFVAGEPVLDFGPITLRLDYSDPADK